MQPRAIRETSRPVLPSLVYSIAFSCSWRSFAREFPALRTGPVANRAARSPAVCRLYSRRIQVGIGEFLRRAGDPGVHDQLGELSGLDSVEAHQHGPVAVEMRGGEVDSGIVGDQCRLVSFNDQVRTEN